MYIHSNRVNLPKLFDYDPRYLRIDIPQLDAFPLPLGIVTS